MEQHHDFESSSDAFAVKLDRFEGPLDLLLHLIKKNEVNIHDIPIALITAQYLDAIALMQELDLDVAGDYLVMAATLIHIKSKMLLPRPETAAAVAGRRRSIEPSAVKRAIEPPACGARSRPSRPERNDRRVMPPPLPASGRLIHGLLLARSLLHPARGR